MSARILFSLSDDKSRAAPKRQHVGCMNGIFHILSGSRRPAIIAAAGQYGNCDAEEDTMSMGEVTKAAVKERHRLSTDSSRSSASSSCYSSGFSSLMEDNRLAKMEPTVVAVKSTEQRAKDLPRLQRGDKLYPTSGAMAYVDSPRPILPSKVARERNSNSSVSVSSRDFPSHRFSCDGRESRDAIKSDAVKLKEQPRHSLDSKWQSSIVAKLMGLESARDAQVGSLKPQTGHERNNSVDISDASSASSRMADEYKHDLRADLVVRLKSNASQVLDRVALATKETPPQSPSLSVYGELEKRLEQIKFKRSGKDLRALKQILRGMQKSSGCDNGRKQIHHAVADIDTSDFMTKFDDCSVTKPARSRNPRGIQRNSSDQQRSDALHTRASSRHARYANRGRKLTNVTDERRQVVESGCRGTNCGNSRTQLQSKRPELADSRRTFIRSGSKRREPASPCRTPKSKVSGDLVIDYSRKPGEHCNVVSMQSDDDASLVHRDDDSQVSSYHAAQEKQTPKKVLLQSKVYESSPLRCVFSQVKQPSPVSVLTQLDNGEPLSQVKMKSEDGESAQFHRQDQGLRASAEWLPDKKHDHTYILQTPDADSLMTVQLRDECSLDNEEGDYIKAILRKDMGCESWSWSGRFDDSSVVLDMERLIFKDLVTEVMTLF